MRFRHPETQQVFESLSGNAKAIVKAVVYEQKSGKGLLVSRLGEAVREGDANAAVNEVLSHIRGNLTQTLGSNVFEIVESRIGDVLRVKHPEKPLDQIRKEEEEARFGRERLAAK